MVHAHHAEEVHVELALRLRGLGKFDRAGDAEARVVDEHIEPALPLDDFSDRRGGLGLVRDIAADMTDALKADGFLAAHFINGAAHLHQRERGVFADAGAAARDQYDFAHISPLFFYRLAAMMSIASSSSASVCVAI